MTIHPASPAELAAALADASERRQTITLGGAFTKEALGGPVEPADTTISTAGLTRVLQYEPRDLTISLEAGMRVHDLNALLAKDRQMVPLDPPLSATGTVGGTLSANLSGPRRRLYGTARDLVIGMTFATLEGKLVQSGGMVVKNVAGLDMGKLLLGSFGTLAALATVNFKLLPMPEGTQTHIWSFPKAEAAFAKRDEVIKGVMQPAAVDYLNPAGAASLKRQGHLLIVQVNGTESLLQRANREFAGAEIVNGENEAELWRAIREFCPEYLTVSPEGAVLRVSTTLTGLLDLARTTTEQPMLARAANGIAYLCYPTATAAASAAQKAPGPAVVEWAPLAHKKELRQWPAPGSDFAIMKKIKEMFDPQHILNRGRLYGQL